MLTYTIQAEDHLRRADSFLRNLLPKAPLSYIKKLLSAGHVKVNGNPAAASDRLRIDDQVTVKESGKTAAMLERPRFMLDILYEDSWIVSFNKPAGLAVHRTENAAEPNLVELGEKFLAQRGEPLKLRPVNRLDKGTSGAIIMAKNGVAAGMFGRMVKEEGLGKLYLALVEGTVEEQGVIDLPLEGKESQTRYRRLLQGSEGAFLAVYPLTGRMHQIRQHLRAIGRPILGDLRYGGAGVDGFTGHALHSFTTRLTHPATEEALQITAPLPGDFLDLLMTLTGIEEKEAVQLLEGSEEK
ncbi:RluA family pseudouridine synthase [Geomesophilobacter sediminis]|uniref:RluA family pseudouridine synthase n=1 Tax=Geomesophilobacter sediminis TaxID=2798584 RepID=A0A8J7M1G6_9BACT|nr:RluA family pseudouridine synthase [Geomesophilobacter sediminis]MBJ6726950.1 RluA family pseudouridine synthase [Geomesophilobacter sediminis]